MAIILLAFIPVFALTGQEGKLFHPLAFTKTFAVLAATVIAVTLVPVLCTLLLGGQVPRGRGQPGDARAARGSTGRCSHGALAHRRADARPRRRCCSSARWSWRARIGSEFMPPLNEGDLMFMPIADPEHLARGEHQDRREAERRDLMTFPEVAYAVAKVARADTSTDPAPLNMTETIVHLKPRDQWRPGMTLDRLRAEMGAAVAAARRVATSGRCRSSTASTC